MAPKAWMPTTSADIDAAAVHLSRDRSLPWMEWEHYTRSFPILLDATRRCIRIVRPHLLRMNQLNGAGAKKTRDAFELFGIDYLLDEDFRPYLLEFNSAPVLHDTEDYMIESMLNLVLPRGLTAPAEASQATDDPPRWISVILDEPDGFKTNG